MDIGQTLKKHREERGISLGELAKITRVPEKHLADLEAGAFERLPGDVFVKGFIRAHARAVGADDVTLAADFEASRSPAPDVTTQMPAAIVQEPDRGKRFGVAIALVILLILFTLALSIVLQPRQRNVPVELSFNHVVAPLRLVVGRVAG